MADDPWEAIGLEFYPWKGPNYENSVFGIRILVMGESTYLGPKDSREEYQKLRQEYGPACFAKSDISKIRSGEWKAGFWTKWINGLLGRPTTRYEELQMILDNVAFWNYADGPPLNGHSKYPPDTNLKESNRKLRQVIKKLEPRLVILMSRRLWHELAEREDPFAVDPGARHGAVCEDEVGNAAVNFLSICHPRGFSRKRDWRAIREGLNKLGGHQPQKPT